MCFFFFQAEDGIRDKLVTGVQTCALPISDRHLLIEAERPGDAAGAPVVHVHAHALGERHVGGGVETRVVCRRQREPAALALEAVEPADGELVAQRWAARYTVVARQERAPVREVQIGEATEQPRERGTVAEQLPAESPGVHADGQVEATLVAERRWQMEPAGRIPDVAYRRAAVGG